MLVQDAGYAHAEVHAAVTTDPAAAIAVARYEIVAASAVRSARSSHPARRARR